MTRLRQKMLEDLERRNYSANTARCYLRAVEHFARYFQQAPDQLGPEQIRQYQAHLFRDRKLADHTVAQRLTALRFFYNKTLGYPDSNPRGYSHRTRRNDPISAAKRSVDTVSALSSHLGIFVWLHHWKLQGR